MNNNEVIDELIETYRSIDIRIFCFKKDNAWHNIFTIIRFRRETMDELKKIYHKLAEKCQGIIKTEEFRVGTFQYEIEKWGKIKSDLSNKFLCLQDDFAINYTNPVDYNYQAYNAYNHSDKEFVFKNWKAFNAYHEFNDSPHPAYNDKLLDKAIENHFSHFDDYLGAIFEYDKYDFQRHTWINTISPVYIQVKDIKFEHDKVTTTVIGHHQNNLELVFNFYGEKFRPKAEFVEKKIGNIVLDKKEELIQKDIVLDIDTKSLTNEFELLIIKNKKILLEEERDKISNHWEGIGEYTNPFYFMFEKFVKFKNLESMLFELKAEGMKNPKKIFERGISLLLSILHIPNTMLDEFEKSGIGADIVSIDIIGMLRKNHIILANVTTGLPKQSDFDRERDYRVTIKKQLKNEKIEVTSIYFTAREPTESENSANLNNVNLIGKSRIKMILDHIKEGDAVFPNMTSLSN